MLARVGVDPPGWTLPVDGGRSEPPGIADAQSQRRIARVRHDCERRGARYQLARMAEAERPLLCWDGLFDAI